MRRAREKKRGGWRAPTKPVVSASFRMNADLLVQAEQLAVRVGISRGAVLRMAIESGLPVARARLLQERETDDSNS